MAQTSIEWTDATWNPVRGCTKVSPGCANRYAETFAERFRGVPGHPYEQGFDLRLVPEKLTEPLSWKKPRRVFVNSMSDLFQDGVSFDYVDRVFATMALTPQHTYQVLTKRADRMREYMNHPGRAASIAVEVFKRFTRLTEADVQSRKAVKVWPLPNVWLGCSVENQHFADERIPLLLQTPAAVRFISAEPLLEKIMLDNGETSWLSCTSQVTEEQYEAMTPEQQGQHCCCERFDNGNGHFRGIDWVIVGGESGPQARHFDLAWGRSIVRQCNIAGVPVFVKQLGAMPFDPNRIDEKLGYVDLRDRKGGDPQEWPEDLRVRQFPEGRA